MDFIGLAAQCAPDVHIDTMARIVRVESSFNPFAIGVVGARLARPPRNLDEAVATVNWLEANGYNYSVGLAQVNKTNFARYGLNKHTAFDACANLRAGGEILKECFSRARKNNDEQDALRAAFSCYYSGNFITGFKHGYVLKVVSGGQPAKSSKSKTVAVAPAAATRPITPRLQASTEELATQGASATSALMF